MDKNFSNNADKMNVLIADLHKNLQEVYLGGGVKKIENDPRTFAARKLERLVF